MIKISKLKTITLLSFFMLFLAAVSVFAAEISFDTKTREVKTNQLFEVGVFIDTNNDEINAIEGKIIFPQDLLKIEVKEIRDGNSIINFWIERPRVKNGEIFFSGIIPGGYIDRKGLIFSVVFQAPREGWGSIEIRDTRVLLNDGKGTATNTTISNLQLVISGQGSSSNITTVEKKDTDMPEVFKPIVTSDPTIFDGKFFLVFATQDKGSGINHYEIKEVGEFKIWKWKFKKRKYWSTGESPYLLDDQKLKSYIYIKAVDKVGNERIAVVEPRYPPRWFDIWWIWSIVVLVIIFLFIVVKRKI